MKQRILAGMGIAAAMAFLVGCGEITFSGLFNIHEPITFVQEGKSDQNGNWQNFRSPVNVTLPAGQFNAKAIIGQSGKKKQLKLEVNSTNPATVVELSFDKNINVNDNFTITAAQLKQNFDLTGNVVTKIDRSAEQSGWEYCSVQVPQTVCRAMANTAKENEALESVTAEISKLGGFPGGQPGFNGPAPYIPNPPVCHTIWTTRPGNMNVRFYYETTNRDITASFMQSVKSLGEFQGHASSTEKIITYRGQCY